MLHFWAYCNGVAKRGKNAKEFASRTRDKKCTKNNVQIKNNVTDIKFSFRLSWCCLRH